MPNTLLLHPTGAPHVDATLAQIVAAFARTFPNQVRACYLLGSYAEESAVPLSDLDCCLVLQRPLEAPGERAEIERVTVQCAAASSVRLDLVVCAEQEIAQLYPFFQVALKLGSRLVYGTDLRDAIALPPLPVYAADATASAQFFIARLRGHSDISTAPVAYPDSSDEFFGYTAKSIAAWYPSAVSAGTKELVAAASRIATALVVRQTGHYVIGKRHAVALFEQSGDPWVGFMAELFRRCKTEWHYLVPEAADERQALRAICQRMLAFENAFLARCRAESAG